MSTHPPTFLVLRVWWEPSADGPQWRASLYDPQGQTRQHFTAPVGYFTSYLRISRLVQFSQGENT